MSKGARIRKLKEEEARFLMGSKRAGPRVSPKHQEMILAIIRAFELQHRTVVVDAPILAGYISQAHQGALERGFLAYHSDLMQAIDHFFENDDIIDGEIIKRALIDFLNMPGQDTGEDISKQKEPGDGHREARPEKIHPLEQDKDKDPRDTSDENEGGIPGIRDQNLQGPGDRPSDPEGKEGNS